ncbi:MAG: MFS transporter [Actinomycetota bacterium]|nr:MFS transporter [Actinomycetota bacterium]
MPTDTLGRRLPLLTLIAANAVSLFGNTIAAVAIPWFVLVTTGSAARAGVAAFFTTVPLALGALFGGTVADRVGPRIASVVGDLLSAAAVAGIPVLHAAGVLEFWHILVLGFLGALFDAPAQAAREALIPELAERAGTPLDRANALWTSTEHAGYILGAPAAGILIAAFGAPTALWVDAASFVAAAIAVAAVVPHLRRERPRTPYLADLVDGVRFIARNRTLRTFLVFATIGNFLIAPVGFVILPVYAKEVFDSASSLAAMTAAYGAGGLAGAVLLALVGGRVRRRAWYVAGWVVYPLASAALIPLPQLSVALPVLFAIGVVAGGIGPIEQSVRQERTPTELRARVFATFMASLAAVVPLSVLAAGLAVELAGLRSVVVVIAAGNALLAVVVITSRAVREL